jgi:hypothetical protein
MERVKEVGNWKLEIENWRLKTVDCETRNLPVLCSFSEGGKPETKFI